LTAVKALQHPWLLAHDDRVKHPEIVQTLRLDLMRDFASATQMKRVALIATAVQLDPSELDH